MSSANLLHAAVFGLGWGDEGKGKVVDLLCPSFDAVVRFNGGANAGHTVCVGDDKFAMHLLPAGALHEQVTAVIGPGVVIDPFQLLKEIDELAARGIDVSKRLKISDRAHVVLEYHKTEDNLSESAAGEEGKIGTTARGIGPCYADKMRRTHALRMADLIHDANLDDRLRTLISARSNLFTAMYGQDGGLDVERIVNAIRSARDRLRPFVCDTTAFLAQLIDDGKRILFEGANGILLDVDHGTYPFVTSSSTGPHGIGAGAGVAPPTVTCAIGTLKAYATRVGAGPFVSELDDPIGDQIRKQGNEFGTTTGRPRRCGWFDAVASRYGVLVGGATDVAMMHLDTLSGFERVGVCVAYEVNGKRVTHPPAYVGHLEQAKPVFEYLPGWSENLREVRRFEDLPLAARNYIERLEVLIGVPIGLIGVGPDRTQTLVRGRMRELTQLPQPSVA